MDKDLTTPKHDEMMLWLDENMEQFLLLSNLITYNPRWMNIADLTHRCQSVMQKSLDYFARCTEGGKERSKTELERISQQSSKRTAAQQRWEKEARQDLEKMAQRDKAYIELQNWVKSFSLGPPPTKPPFCECIREIKWEFPITTEKRYIIGFMDMVIVLRYSSLYINGLSKWEPGINSREFRHLESAVNCNGELNLDRLVTPKWDWGWFQDQSRPCLLNIEIKTKIPSLGELLRQIRMYQMHQGGHYVVICPDDRFKEPLASQGITLIKYDPSAYTAARFEHGESG